MMVHICNPSYAEDRGRRIWFIGQPRAKAQDPI
jgi:hypothetical protein